MEFRRRRRAAGLERIWANLKATYVAWQFWGRALGTDAGTSAAATARNNAYAAG